MSRSMQLQCFGRQGQPVLNFESKTELHTHSQEVERRPSQTSTPMGRGTLERLRNLVTRQSPPAPRAISQAHFQPPTVTSTTIDIDVEKQ